MACLAPAAALSEQAMAERLRACTACHGEDAIEIEEGYVPRIQGKPAGYLYNQLRNYQAMRRRNDTMNHMVRHLSDVYLWEIAEHFAGRTPPYPEPATPPANPAVAERGRMLVREGDPGADVPACQACHGERLAGALPATPGLIGLPRHYIMGQLGAWREGERRAAAPDCMAAIVERLSPSDIAAVAAWLASRPLPVDTDPAPAAAVDPPMECGSIEEPAR
ncbi:c-type cytochrome [Ectothiorhodospiraceae bacterium WFHF3C12]|nr:c-type cytochrome [Ectothiorhodospiraceae bacterium WFHF3C12]